MNLFLVKAKVSKRIFGISGPFLSTEGKLVWANDINHAKSKFESAIRTHAANMQCESIDFEYIELMDEIK